MASFEIIICLILQMCNDWLQNAPASVVFKLVQNVVRLPAGRSSGAAERGEAHTSNAQAQVRETKNISVLLKVVM